MTHSLSNLGSNLGIVIIKTLDMRLLTPAEAFPRNPIHEHKEG